MIKFVSETVCPYCGAYFKIDLEGGDTLTMCRFVKSFRDQFIRHCRNHKIKEEVAERLVFGDRRTT